MRRLVSDLGVGEQPCVCWHKKLKHTLLQSNDFARDRYVPPGSPTCYFKSTDGHHGGWGCSTKRLNVHVAVAAAKAGGALLVDSTRKGKRFPDSFNKTVPIWACVLNRAVQRLRQEGGVPDPEGGWDTALHVPVWVVSALAHVWANSLCRFLKTHPDRVAPHERTKH